MIQYRSDTFPFIQIEHFVHNDFNMLVSILRNFGDIIASELMLKYDYKFALCFIYYQQRIFDIFMFYCSY